uniref:GTP cyclohydrolase 1 feedback regulatory protein n=1 Tax=Steinernema glaseri TaxID=37863 RepID=A0A1I7ZY34_9BILA
MESPFPSSMSAPLLSRRDSTMSSAGGASHIIITCAAKNLFKGPTRVSPPSDWSIVELLKIQETVRFGELKMRTKHCPQAVLDLLSTRGFRVVSMTSGGGDFENLKYVWVLAKENEAH